MSSEASKTPETDAIWNKIIESGCSLLSKEHRDACAEAAKNGIENLERERDEARKALAEADDRDTKQIDYVAQLCARIDELENRRVNLAAELIEFEQNTRITINQLRIRVAELEKLLKRWLPFGEFNAPTPSHNGPCGPESCCDAGCMDAAIASVLIQETRQAIDSAKGEK